MNQSGGQRAQATNVSRLRARARTSDPTADGGRMSQPINLGEKLELFDEHWQPKIVAQLNDYDVRIVKVKRESRRG